MDLYAELKECKRQKDDGEIDDNEFKKRKTLIISKWTKSKETKKTEDSHVVNQPKAIDLYAILQLKPDAIEAEIKSSYKKLALKYHPDKNSGTRTEEWDKLSKAYEILSDSDRRFLYDNHGTINNSLGCKASLNHCLGGESWQPYIGEVELGLWMYSFMDNKNSPELENLNSAEQKARRHNIRLSSITNYLQNKLSRFPKNDSEQFKKTLRRESQILIAEPNGKELLSCLGNIYTTKANAYLDKYKYSSTVLILSILAFMAISLISGLELTTGVIPILGLGCVVSAIQSKGGASNMSQEETYQIFWRLSRSEISSIVAESCDKILKNNSGDNRHIANSLLTLGEVWLKTESEEKAKVSK
ncbi:9734_t:CDS:2 [Entrophospora sp. SA101]|nr:9826_t:CDS:2 [Entrophospora sp. SA101]CAJ0649614.1 9734_t:CDS:2 [Entrophospora sp. SA101]CAJ0831518.1 5326_t:CDS:2 [Entrophospora sp. SA101]CAJ0878721.1 16972_t:CDS:2 [Entrophospora sp. SA101]